MSKKISPTKLAKSNIGTAQRGRIPRIRNYGKPQNMKEVRPKIGRYAGTDNFSKVIINKNTVDIRAERFGLPITMAKAALVESDFLINTPGIDTLGTMSEEVLYTLAITKIEPNVPSKVFLGPQMVQGVSALNGQEGEALTGKDFSFINLKNRDEGIDDPRITDPDIHTLTPELIVADEKFIDRNDPFYEHDELKTDVMKSEEKIRELQSKVSLIPIAESMAYKHLSISTAAGAPTRGRHAGTRAYPRNKYLNGQTTQQKRSK